MRLLRYTLANVAPDATDAAAALARFTAFFDAHLETREAVAWLSVSQSRDAPLVAALADLFADDAAGFTIGGEAKTARDARAALPAPAGQGVAYGSPAWTPARTLMPHVPRLATLPKGAYLKTWFSLGVREATWRVAPSLRAYVSLANGKGTTTWTITASADVIGASSRDADVKRAIAALSTKTGLPFAEKKPKAFDRAPAEDVASASDAIARLDAAFEALKPKARALASKADLAIVTTTVNWGRQMGATPRPPVAFEAPLRAAFARAIPEYARDADEPLAFVKRLGAHASLALEVERRSGLGIGRMFQVALVARFDGGAHDRVTWRGSLSSIWGDATDLVHHYVTEAELERLLDALTELLVALLPQIEAAVPRE